MQCVLHKSDTNHRKWIVCYTLWWAVLTRWSNDSWFRIKFPIDGPSLNYICIDLCRYFWCSSSFLTLKIDVVQSELFTVENRHKKKTIVVIQVVICTKFCIFCLWAHLRESSPPFITVHQTPSDISLNITSTVLYIRNNLNILICLSFSSLEFVLSITIN